MSYVILDIEITQPLPIISLNEGETGIAVLLRRKGRPIHFWLEDLSDRTSLTSKELSLRISEKAGPKLLSEMIREELHLPQRRMELPPLSIAICTRNRPDRLERCLESISEMAASFDSQLSVEILVIDNAPPDERTRHVVAARPDVRYVCESRPGLNFARNRALEEATGELLAFLDDDVRVDPGWIRGLLQAYTENPDAGAFTGLVLPHELATRAQILFERRGGFRRGFDKLRYHGQELPGNPLYPCGAGIFGAGANMAFRRNVLLELGGFDEALDTGNPLPGGGDLDVFYRTIRAGYPLVYEPQYLVFHEHRQELDGLRRQYWSWGLGFMAFVTKSYHADPPQRAKFRRLVRWWFKDMSLQLVKSLLGRHVLPSNMIMAELTGGLIGLLGEYGRSQRRVEKIRRELDTVGAGL